MKKALVVGGNSGIGLSMVLELLDMDLEQIYVVGKDEINITDIPERYKKKFLEKVLFEKLNLINEEYGVFDRIKDIDSLIITAGFGRVAHFEELTEEEITNIIKCNELGVIRIIKAYYDKIKSDDDFYCAILGSIAGHIASPLFSVYGASKRGLCGFIENINAELRSAKCVNRILDVSPGAIKGTKFNGGQNQPDATKELAKNILTYMGRRETLYIPDYDGVYRDVLKRYNENPIKFADESYEYKMKSGRKNSKPQVTVGYLSGTFDLFHVGHLNLLRNAKNQCDYLIVGVHKSGAWKGKETFIPFDERVSVLEGIKYVDKVVESLPEDSDAWMKYRYDKLFVGSDYKGSERFEKYEKYFQDKGVEIIYFPYTKGTSSTQIRQRLKES